MVKKIARKEFIEMVRDGRYVCAAVVVSILLLAALAAGWKSHQEAQVERAAARRAAREHWVGQGATGMR
jgi:ABC-2 type transport system permease protein